MTGLRLDRVWSAPLKGLSLHVESGLSVLIGDESDGSGAIVELCAGVREPRRGRVSLGAWVPSASPECRRHVASLLPAESVVPGRTVSSWVAELGALVGFAADAALGPCSLAPERDTSTLSNAERRELSCCIALAHPAPALCVLHDPLAACAPGQRAYVIARIAELAEHGPVLVTTPSLSDARRLGGSTFLLDRGLLSEKPAAAWPGGLTPGLDVWLCVEADAPRGLVSALAQHPDVKELRYDELAGSRVLLRGAELELLATAVARAAVAASVDIRLLRAHSEDLEHARAAETGAVHAAYRAARSHARPEAPPGAPAAGEPPAPDPSS